MPLEKRADGLWFREELYPDVAQSFRVRRVRFRKITRDSRGKKLHELMVLETPRVGNVLTLDGVVQNDESGEIYYHEPLVHCAAQSCPSPPRKVLLVGCDGGTLREVVKYPSVAEIHVVDIDRTVIDAVKEYMPTISQGAFNDPRVQLTIQDGAEFVKQAVRKGKKYDLIVIDSPDPIGPARSLFSTPFYTGVAAILAPKGVMIRQTGSSVYQPDEMPAHWRQMLELFPQGSVQGFMTSVPTYIGGYFTFVAASHTPHVFQRALRTLVQRVKVLDPGMLRWYSAEMHRASMVVPQEVKRMISESEFGRELIVDFYGCDYAVISSTERLKQYAGEICKVIKMKPFGKPIVPNFGFAKSRTAGPSLVQLIETSAITAHYSTHWRMVLQNIFTCATLDAKAAIEFSMKFLGATEAKWELKLRGVHLVRLEPERSVYVTRYDGGKFETTERKYRLVT